MASALDRFSARFAYESARSNDWAWIGDDEDGIPQYEEIPSLAPELVATLHVIGQMCRHGASMNNECDECCRDALIAQQLGLKIEMFMGGV